MRIGLFLHDAQEEALVRGETVTVTLDPQQALTLGQAAEALNVGRRRMVELADQGAIPIITDGRRRHVKLRDVLAYDRKQRAERKAALDEMVRESQEWDYPEITLAEAVAAHTDKENT